MSVWLLAAKGVVNVGAGVAADGERGCSLVFLCFSLRTNQQIVLSTISYQPSEQVAAVSFSNAKGQLNKMLKKKRKGCCKSGTGSFHTAEPFGARGCYASF